MDEIKIETEKEGWMRLYVNGKLVIATDDKQIVLKMVTQLIIADGVIV